MSRDEIERLKWHSHSYDEISSNWVYLTTPLTSTSWDGDARSTEAATLLDLSSVFSVPAGVKAVLVRLACRDSAAVGTYSTKCQRRPIGNLLLYGCKCSTWRGPGYKPNGDL